MSDIFVHYGAGFSVGASWLNFDNSPTLRLERLPLIGGLVTTIARNRQRFPSEIRYGDIRKKPLVAPGTAKGAYASHVLEHLSYREFQTALAHTFEMLAPGGTFRLIVPDLQERARKYLEAVSSEDDNANSDFMKSTYLGMETRPSSFISQFRRAAGGSAHLWMWDEPSMRSHLKRAGFINIRRCSFGDAKDKVFSEIEDPGRFHNEQYDIVELAMSAEKPT